MSWAACANICVPYSTKLDLRIPAGPAARSLEAGLIGAARTKVPQSAAAAGVELVSANVAASGADAALILRLKSKDTPFETPDLFVEGLDKGSPGRPEVALSQAGHTARLTVPIRDADAAGIAGKQLTMTLVDGARTAEFRATPLPAAPTRGASRLFRSSRSPCSAALCSMPCRASCRCCR